MAFRTDSETTRLDDAARAGWLYYVAGNTQDEIARKLGVSRQSAQRLVSLAVSERLIKVRLDHPIARCMELAAAVKQEYGLAKCEVVPSDPASTSTTLGIAEAAAAEMERHLKASQPKIIAVGTGRTLRATVDQLSPMDCPQHRIVSLVGSITPDGSASFYDIISRLADTVRAPHFPMPLPVLATTPEERRVYQDQKPVRNLIAMATRADVTFIGIGNLGPASPIVVDGFMTRETMTATTAAGAVGEVVSWLYDDAGRVIDGLTNDCVTSVPLRPGRPEPVFGIAMGEPKVAAIRGAMRGRLINSLITDEHTAELLLVDDD